MAALLLPLRALQFPLGKGKSVPLPSAIVLTSLKWSKVDMKTVETVLLELPELRNVHQCASGMRCVRAARCYYVTAQIRSASLMACAAAGTI